MTPSRAISWPMEEQPREDLGLAEMLCQETSFDKELTAEEAEPQPFTLGMELKIC